MNDTASALADNEMDDFARAVQRVRGAIPRSHPPLGVRGTTTRPIQEEYYRWWAICGVKMNF
jgi:hypothetical protein